MPNGIFKIEKTAASYLLGLLINHFDVINELFLGTIGNQLTQINPQPFSAADVVEKVINAICEQRGYQGIIKNGKELSNVEYVDYKIISATYKFYVRIILANMVSNKLLGFIPPRSYSLSNSHPQTKVNTFLFSCKRKSQELDLLLKDIKTMPVDMIDYDHWLQQQNNDKKPTEEVFSPLQQENIQLKTEIQQLQTLVKTLTDKLGDQTQYELANEQLRGTISNLQKTIESLQEKIQQSDAEFKNLSIVKDQLWKQLERSSDETKKLGNENKNLAQQNLQLSEKISKLEQELQAVNTTINAAKSVPQQQQQPKADFWASQKTYQPPNQDPNQKLGAIVGVWSRKKAKFGSGWVQNALTLKKRKADENDNSQQTDPQTTTQKTPSQ